MKAGMCASCRVAIGATARNITTETDTAASANQNSRRLANSLDRKKRVLFVNALYISFVVYAPGQIGESASGKGRISRCFSLAGMNPEYTCAPYRRHES